MLTDLDETGRSTVVDPVDFDEFWNTTIKEAEEHDLHVVLERAQVGLSTVDVFDVTFSGFGGHRIRGWLYLPKWVTGPLPAVVQYQGYGEGRGHPYRSLLWSAAGFAHLVMDSRGQGAGYSRGATGDPTGPSGPTLPGVLTNGIGDPHDYYSGGCSRTPSGQWMS
ncbi:cephalosporin-C deacetylase-like acetyl esterase [Glaciihabitans sp. UYNi722]